MKNVLIISTSLRACSNSEYFAKEFARGAEDGGHNVELISLKGKKIAYCTGCFNCQKTQKCAINDDAVLIAEKVKNADIVVFATPIYYYGMSGQMKTLLDRMNSLYTTDYKFRDIYLIATAADDEQSAVYKTSVGMQGWIECYENARLAGVIRGVGINDADDAKNHKEIAVQAYETGKNL